MIQSTTSLAVRWSLAGAIACCLLSWAIEAQAEPFAQAVWPPVVQRGQTVRIELSGQDLDQAVGLWTSLPAGLMEAVPAPDASGGGNAPGTRAVLDVRTAPSAPLGIYGLRLHTRNGLSNVHLFLIDELPLSVRDPALPADAVVKTSLPACVAAAVRPSIVDRYSIEVTAGQRVSFEVIGSRLGHDFDPVVSIYGPSGKLRSLHDNNAGLFFDCRFEQVFSEAGVYQVCVSDARYESGDGWNYVLRMGEFPAASVALPAAARPGQQATLSLPQLSGKAFNLEWPAAQPLGLSFADVRLPEMPLATWLPVMASDIDSQVESGDNHSRETASPVKVPALLHGVLARPGEQDFFTFDLVKGQKWTFQAEARSLGSPADLEILLYDPMNREVRRADDVNMDEGMFTYPVEQDGPHRLLVRDMARDGGPEFVYRVDARLGTAQLQITAEADQLVIPQGSYQPVPLKITRTDFQGPIELSLLGAPAGITLEPAIIPAEAAEIVCAVRAAEGTPLGLATLQIVGRATFGEGDQKTTLQTLARTLPMIDRYLKNVDLIPYGLRENQRRLPPSLTDRLAVAVTPPVPIVVEVPEQLLILPRYQQATFPIAVTRQPGFAGAVSFSVKGGQIGDEAEFRNQLYARFSGGAADEATCGGTLFTRNLTNLAKHRVDLSATTEVEGRRVTLVRTFTLDVKSAFEPKFDPPQVAAPPGGKIKVQAVAARLPGYDGAVTLTPNRQLGLTMPETVVVPAGQPHVEFEVAVSPQMNPGKYRIRFPSSGLVGKYEESITGPELEIEVLKPDAPAAK